VSIKQVAEAAGVSTATVSRTLHNDPLVEKHTAARVWKAIKKLNYYPNRHARSLVLGRSHFLGLIISDITNPFFPELVKSFEAAAIQQGYEVLVSNTGYRPERMMMCVRRAIEARVDGVAIMTSEMDPKFIEELSERGVPIAFYDVGRTGARVSNISVDYLTGIREAVGHLVQLGHRRVGFISGPLNLKSARIRRTAFLKCLRESTAGYDKHLIVEGNHRVEGGRNAMSRLLALPNPPTAILASNDLTAIGAMHSIRRVGLRVPEDISVVGFDDIELSQYTQPPLTTVRLSREELGRKAFECLFQIVEGKSPSGVSLSVTTGLVVRESTGRVLENASNRKSTVEDTTPAGLPQ